MGTDVASLHPSFPIRYYVVHAIQSNRRDKAIDFLANYTLQSASSSSSSTSAASSPSSSTTPFPPQILTETDAAWRQWFVLPHLPEPSRDPQFHVFFSPSWADAFRVSFRNVLTVIFYSLPVPKLLSIPAYDEGGWQVKHALSRARHVVGEQEQELAKWEGHAVALAATVEKLLLTVQIWREGERHHRRGWALDRSSGNREALSRREEGKGERGGEEGLAQACWAQEVTALRAVQDLNACLGKSKGVDRKSVV